MSSYRFKLPVNPDSPILDRKTNKFRENKTDNFEWIGTNKSCKKDIKKEIYQILTHSLQTRTTNKHLKYILDTFLNNKINQWSDYVTKDWTPSCYVDIYKRWPTTNIITFNIITNKQTIKWMIFIEPNESTMSLKNLVVNHLTHSHWYHPSKMKN